MTEKPKTPRFVLDLNEERRALLEAYRARSGLRSLAGAIHALIDGTQAVPIQRLDVDAEHRLAGPLQVEKPARSSKIVDKIGPVTDAKSGLRITHIQVGPAESRPGSRLKGKK